MIKNFFSMHFHLIIRIGQTDFEIKLTWIIGRYNSRHDYIIHALLGLHSYFARSYSVSKYGCVVA